LDDCSTDNSRDIIKQYRNHPKVSKIVYNETNSGSTFKQWQKGIELAQGEWIWIAESDDYCESNFLEVCIKKLLQNLNAALAYSKSIRVDESGKYLDDLSNWYNDLSNHKWNSDYSNNGIDEIKSSLVYKNTIPNASAVVFRRGHIKNYWNKILDFRLCGDWLFWINLLETGDVVYTVETQNFFRTHTKSVRSKTTSSILDFESKKILKYLRASRILNQIDIIRLTTKNRFLIKTIHWLDIIL
jgi:glycosyltransferase involved in cell wall biosynthesis